MLIFTWEGILFLSSFVLYMVCFISYHIFMQVSHDRSIIILSTAEIDIMSKQRADFITGKTTVWTVSFQDPIQTPIQCKQSPACHLCRSDLCTATGLNQQEMTYRFSHCVLWWLPVLAGRGTDPHTSQRCPCWSCTPGIQVYTVGKQRGFWVRCISTEICMQQFITTFGFSHFIYIHNLLMMDQKNQWWEERERNMQFNQSPFNCHSTF